MRRSSAGCAPRGSPSPEACTRRRRRNTSASAIWGRRAPASCSPPSAPSSAPCRRAVTASSRAPASPRPRRCSSALLELPVDLGGAGARLVARVGKIAHLEERPDLDLTVLERGALEPLDRLLLRLHVDEPVAGDQLLGLGEGAVGHRALLPRVGDARALR